MGIYLSAYLSKCSLSIYLSKKIKRDKNLASRDWKKILLFKNYIYQAKKYIKNIKIISQNFHFLFIMQLIVNRFVFGKRLIESFGSCYQYQIFGNLI